jgi:hypothetical protein
MNDDARVLPSPRDRLDIGSDTEALAIVGWLKTKASHDKLYFAPTIPANKLSAARQACQLPDAEQVLALADFTTFGSVKECLVVSWSAVHYRWPSGLAPKKIEFAKFVESEITSSWSVVAIGKDNQFAPGAAGLSEVVTLLKGLQEALVKGVPAPSDSASGTNSHATTVIPRWAYFIVLGLMIYFAQDILAGKENPLFLVIILLVAVGYIWLLAKKTQQPTTRWKIGGFTFDWRNALLVLIPGIAWTAYSPGGRAEPSYMLSLVAGLAILYSVKKYKD